ncbi:myo-inositol 2-dehydrogenase [Mesorhizobium hungaricum]|jgi:myo-inositol 2-dehydrogenase / D-chiro-inositol 1-dehydrogenase|uniref:Myo-inositol 2-dehydrogenase n=1 Tax=Mesorhizobium hungaricum TaxID=1566387 RepID=A0A1C2E354_9HYPH|nr:MULTISPECIES: Gfo/Idh/MocA family oxidoreductase [Mesorhizobium]MBN9235783.1 Gfo/Idh/MocA family oxidoreductase [Mesorhizobium sp.]MDQ0333123.1 myo-inositol 2-dehydrogenase/D-chiro-inositol 1-dehydrogenase [Mesorhizobium sp. YL-MeA3-2017]OCX21447.1 myo-inositol 2-dehydrogenase [Mesorhizobium hungaricum]
MNLAVGVIGAGIMGTEHARILCEDTPGARLAAICDADESRARAAGRGQSQVFSDPHALIFSDKVDAVVIAAPDSTHKELALACIEAGKPVLCEKPLAVTAAEAIEVVEAEVAKGRKLVQVGYMRRFDPPYVDMRRVRESGGIGDPVILHNVHRNAVVPEWFTGAMSVTNAFVHEIDISRWLLGAEMISAQAHCGVGGDPLLVTMETDRGEIVSTEVFMNCRYGYHVHAQLVGRDGTIETAVPITTLTNASGRHEFGFPDNWVPRFRTAYANQMKAWVAAAAGGRASDGANAWDGYVTTSIAEQVVAALEMQSRVRLSLMTRPSFYD